MLPSLYTMQSVGRMCGVNDDSSALQIRITEFFNFNILLFVGHLTIATCKETAVDIQRTTLCYMPADRSLHNHCNLQPFAIYQYIQQIV
jgi:hypothetical protein